jgi:hypothetical protein
MSKRQRKRVDVFYVVTRAGRRTSPQDFWTWREAQEEATKMRGWLKKWNDPHANRVEVVKTGNPRSIY